MPIVDVELIAGSAHPDAAATQALADALGDVFEAAPGKVWLRMRALPAGQYAENRAAAPSPVFVRVTASAPPEGERLRQRIAAITQAVARATGRPAENVHVEFMPAARGRIAFGGRLVE